eukprot:gene2507-3105_t
MIRKQLDGVEFVVANTDAQALAISESGKVVQMGKKLTMGLGAGAVPEIGRKACEESIEEVMNQIGETQMLFVTAGMGGGTGTGAAPVVAAAAKAKGILTVGIVTKPFQFEGRHRMRIAEQGLAELEQSVDSLIVIPNQRLMEVSNDIFMGNAFQLVDDVLYNGIKGISDILIKPGLINLDFADIRSIMCNSGKALMGVGEAEGKGRAEVAAQMALNNPLLENINISGARGVLINISGADLKLNEVDQIVSLVSGKVDPSANIIFGSTFDKELDNKIRVTLIVTGMNNQEKVLDQQPTLNQQQQPILNQQQSKFGNTQESLQLNQNFNPYQKINNQQQAYQQPPQQQQQQYQQQIPQQQQYQQQMYQQPQQQIYQQSQQQQPKSSFSFSKLFTVNNESVNNINNNKPPQPNQSHGVATPGSNFD